MDAFVSRKRKHAAREGIDKPPPTQSYPTRRDDVVAAAQKEDEECTEVKLATLASLCHYDDTSTLLETLLAAGGSVETAAEILNSTHQDTTSPRKKSSTSAALGYQSSLSGYTILSPEKGPAAKKKRKQLLTKKGRTLHLYSPEDVAEHTPCSIIHNFLPPEQADALLRELVAEAPTWHRDEFQLFDRTVVSPHTSCFYVDGYEATEQQKAEYVYNGKYISNVRQTLPEMLKVSRLVQHAVNAEIATRIRTHYPGQTKLKHQSSRKWVPNTAVVNCYDGAKQSVGWHTDQLTYLGPRAVIGSLSLGVAREFRVRRIIPRTSTTATASSLSLQPENETANIPSPSISNPHKPTPSSSVAAAAAAASTASATGEGEGEEAGGGGGAEDITEADTQGQIAIHLPHNSLLVMHAEMQEAWKHSIAPATTIQPHPLALNKRINVTYRCYRAAFAPSRRTPRCRCGMPCQLKCVQRAAATRGRYMWTCDVGFVPGRHSCGFFQWAEFDDEGEPPWSDDFKQTPETTPARAADRPSDVGEDGTGAESEAARVLGE